jgi:hypothetical protein
MGLFSPKIVSPIPDAPRETFGQKLKKTWSNLNNKVASGIDTFGQKLAVGLDNTLLPGPQMTAMKEKYGKEAQGFDPAMPIQDREGRTLTQKQFENSKAGLPLNSNIVSPVSEFPPTNISEPKPQVMGTTTEVKPSIAPSPSSMSFGMGTEEAKISPELFDELMKIKDEADRIKIAELSGQESSYGYNLQNINPKEESYGAFHINLQAGRTNPRTGKPFTKEEAMNPELATNYAYNEMKNKGLGSWNPGSFDWYQNELPKRAQTKKFVRGSK